MRFKYLWMLIIAAVIVGGFVALKPKDNYAPPKTVSASLVVKDNRLVSGSSIIKVLQNDTVNIKIIDNKREELHIHGYDKKLELEPNKLSDLSFVANISGNFEFELEGTSTTIGHIQVSPR